MNAYIDTVLFKQTRPTNDTVFGKHFNNGFVVLTLLLNATLTVSQSRSKVCYMKVVESLRLLNTQLYLNARANH